MNELIKNLILQTHTWPLTAVSVFNYVIDYTKNDNAVNGYEIFGEQNRYFHFIIRCFGWLFSLFWTAQIGG